MDVSLALQILTLVVAAIGPIVAFRYAKRLSIGANRQAWLDALREDIAELISIGDTVSVSVKLLPDATDADRAVFLQLMREKMEKGQVVRFRIRLRLRTGNPKHDRLNEAVALFIQSHRQPTEERNPLRENLVAAAEDVIQHVWGRIEKGQ